jgi:hypothetical protein
MERRVTAVDRYFETRLSADHRRDRLWQTLWQAHFRRLISPSDTVLDLGAGHGSFINQVQAGKRIAVSAT